MQIDDLQEIAQRLAPSLYMQSSLVDMRPNDFARASTRSVCRCFSITRCGPKWAKGCGQAQRHQLPTVGWRLRTHWKNCALSYLADKQAANADTMITLARHVLTQIVMRQMTPIKAVERGSVAIEGDASKLPELFVLLDEFRLIFPRQMPASPPILLVCRPRGAEIPRGMACRKGRRQSRKQTPWQMPRRKGGTG